MHNALVIAAFVGLPLMFACLLNMQLFMWRPQVHHQNTVYELVAKYNKYLFKSRGVKVSDYMIEESGCDSAVML